MFWRIASGLFAGMVLLLKYLHDLFRGERNMHEEQGKVVVVRSFVHQNCFGLNLSYRVSQERGHTATRFAGARLIDEMKPAGAGEGSPIPPPPEPPASPDELPGRVIVFPSRSDGPSQPSASPKAPGEVIEFPSRPKESRPNYVLLDRVLEELLLATQQQEKN